MPDVWKSKDSQIISRYAERLEPIEGEQEESGTPTVRAKPQVQNAGRVDGIDFRYMDSPPAKDLLNYKNMDLEMSLWAKTQAGWMSVAVLLVLATLCFILTWILWGMHGY